MPKLMRYIERAVALRDNLYTNQAPESIAEARVGVTLPSPWSPTDGAHDCDAYDLFVSYGHADNHDGWITELVDAIKSEHACFTPRPLNVFSIRT